MDKLLTAWDLISKAPNSGYSERESCIDWNDIENIMIEFAILHVEAALQTVQNKLEYYEGCNEIKDLYPLDNIK